MVVLGFVGRMDDVESFLPPRNGRREMQRKIALAPSFGFFFFCLCLALLSSLLLLLLLLSVLKRT